MRPVVVPEQLKYFERGKIDHYASLQKTITVNASRRLEDGGLFLYVTCSVFKKENEDVVSFIGEHTPLKLLKMQYLKGYDKRADTLFTALFRL
jgi:16S rRNA (cytosine967-C5)-methyltransferase